MLYTRMRVNQLARQRWLKAFAERFPVWFAFAFFGVSTGLVLLDTFVLPFGLANTVLQALLAFAVLFWFGWTSASGFNGPSSWRSLQLLWLPALLTIISVSTIALVGVPRASVLLGAAVLTLLTGLNEEARFRGVILQALLPYGWLRAALLSALFFSAAHLVNALVASPLVVAAQLLGAFLQGFAYAALRLRTNTIWPLVVIHACGDLTTVIVTLTGRGITLAPTIGISLYAGGIVQMLVLAVYGLFLLRGQHDVRAPAVEVLSR